MKQVNFLHDLKSIEMHTFKLHLKRNIDSIIELMCMIEHIAHWDEIVIVFYVILF